MEKGTESPPGVPNSGTPATIAEPIPPLLVSLKMYVGGRSQVEAAKQAIRKGDRVGAGKSKHEIRMPFDVLDSAVADFLRDYAPGVVKFDRGVITPALVDFKLHHIEFEDLGKITLRKLSDAVTELSVDTPHGPTLLEAAIHLLKWEKNLSGEERQALTDLARQIETQIDAGAWPIIKDNTHWFENLPAQEREEKLLLLQQKMDAACDELSEVRKRNQQQITQKLFARTRFDISDKLIVNLPAAQATPSESTSEGEVSYLSTPPASEREFTFDASAKQVRDFMIGETGPHPRKIEWTDGIDYFVLAHLRLDPKLDAPVKNKIYGGGITVYMANGDGTNMAQLREQDWLINGREVYLVGISQTEEDECKVALFYLDSRGWFSPREVDHRAAIACMEFIHHWWVETINQWQEKQVAPAERGALAETVAQATDATKEQDATNKSWQRHPEEPDMMGKPGRPELDEEERVYRMALAQEGEEIKGKERQKTWKEIAQQINWKYGTSKAGVKKLEEARNMLKRANEDALAHIAEWRKTRKTRK